MDCGAHDRLVRTASVKWNELQPRDALPPHRGDRRKAVRNDGAAVRAAFYPCQPMSQAAGVPAGPQQALPC